MALSRIGFKGIWVIALITLVLSCFCCPVWAADWPNWRGSDYNGISAETGWDPAKLVDGLKPLWKASIGTGFSSMAVSEGCVYTIGNIKNKDIVYCFDAATGKEIWAVPYDHPIDAKYYDGGPSATPTVADGKVYTMSKRGNVYCIDARTGSVIWNKDLKKELSVKIPRWGQAGSVLVIDDMLILNVGTSGVALNKADGSVIWQNGKEASGYATAVPYSVAGKKCVAMFTAKTITALEVSTGKPLWELPWKTKYSVNAADPIILGDKVFISSGYGRGCTLLQIDGSKVKQIYENKNMRNQCYGSVLWKGHIYGFDGQVGDGSKGQLVCVELETSQVKWAQKGMGTGTVMIADGKLVILSEKGKLVIAEASPAGFKEISSAQVLEGRCWTVPVLANGKVYARNAKGDLVCVDLGGEAVTE